MRIGTSLAFVALMARIASALPPALSLVVTIAFLAWSVTILSYISFHHHRLGKLITAASDEGDPEKTVVSDVVDSGEDTQAVLAML